MDEEILGVAGYCGFACKACSVYIASCAGGEALERRAAKAGMTAKEMYCKGCRSDKTSSYCAQCEIKKCIREKKLNWCSECTAYPCERILAFKDSLPHRVEVCESLEFAKSHTLIEWTHKMKEDFTCDKCGSYNSVYAKECIKCGNENVNAFAKRHWKIIEDSPERENV